MSKTSPEVTDGILGLEMLDIPEGPCSSMILPFVGFEGTDPQSVSLEGLGMFLF